jgi:hypothetical protein
LRHGNWPVLDDLLHLNWLRNWRAAASSDEAASVGGASVAAGVSEAATNHATSQTTVTTINDAASVTSEATVDDAASVTSSVTTSEAKIVLG